MGGQASLTPRGKVYNMWVIGLWWDLPRLTSCHSLFDRVSLTWAPLWVPLFYALVSCHSMGAVALL